MTDASDADQVASTKAKPPARKKGGGLKHLEPPRTPRDDADPTGMVGVFAILLDMDRRGEVGRIIERWPVTTLAELRDAIDAAIEVVNEAGGADIGLRPFDVVLSYFPRAQGKPYRVSFKNRRQPFDEV